MQFNSIFKALGVIVLVVALGLLVPLAYSYLTEQRDFIALAISFGVTVVAGLLLLFIPKSERHFKSKDGFALVSFGWLAAGLFGALPFWFSGATASFTDAYFESISGFTTTGASILSNIEGLSPELLLWRSLTQWFGGMGIIVLTLAIVPYLNIGGGMSLFQAEVPGPTAEKLTPRIQDTAKVLWEVYAILTVILIGLLWLAGYSLFDATCHAFTTMSTGGFSTQNTSVAGFHNPLAEWIILLFMTIAVINFALHYHFFFRNFKVSQYWRDAECQFYLGLLLAAALTILATIYFTQEGLDATVIRGVFFTVVSIMTTTGFGTADYEYWPVYGQFLLLLLMLVGGSAGSTAGGMKTVRVLLIFKYMYGEMLKLLHPNLVRTVKLGEGIVGRSLLSSILGFSFIYLTVMICSVLLVSIEISDLTTAISAVIACLSNIGPGLGEVGPTDNYGHLGSFTKWVLSLNMVMGRLEILTLLLLFLPQTWKKG